MDPGRELVDAMHDLLGTRDVDGLVDLYAPDAEIIRYEGTSRGPEEIKAFWDEFLWTHEYFDLHTLEQFRAADDIVMWDAVADTVGGFLQTSNVVVVDETGRIRRHMPGIRGYWGL